MTTGSPSDRFQRTDGLDLSKITPSFCLIWDFQHYLSTMTFLTLHFKEHMNIDMVCYSDEAMSTVGSATLSSCHEFKGKRGRSGTNSSLMWDLRREPLV